MKIVHKSHEQQEWNRNNKDRPTAVKLCGNKQLPANALLIKNNRWVFPRTKLLAY
jgi:hypothetical protein